MKMIAVGTIHGRELVKDADPKNPKSKAKYRDLIAAPGNEFDSEKFGMSDAEVTGAIARGVAKRKTREVADDGDDLLTVTGAGAPPSTTKALDNMSLTELNALAADRGVAVKAGATKAELIATLNAASAA